MKGDEDPILKYLNDEDRLILKEKECYDDYLKKLKEMTDFLKKIDQREQKIIEMQKQKLPIKPEDKYLTPEEFEKIRNFARTKGGFLTCKIRRSFYRKFYCITEKNNLEYIIEEKDNNIKRNDPHNLFCFKKKSMLEDNKSNEEDEKIIKNDAIRSKIYFSMEHYYKTNDPSNLDNIQNISNSIKANLEVFIKEMSALNQNIYHYYQGYHDIGLYFMLLYYNPNSPKFYDEYAVNVFQHFTEFNLKENLQKSDSTYNMMNCMDIIKYLIQLISPKTDNYLNGLYTFTAPWILSHFSHVIMSTRTVFRLLDYFITNHPMAVYHLSAWIVIEKVKTINFENVKNEGELFLEFQNINFDDPKQFDVEYYIKLCDKSLKKYPVDSDMKKFFKGLGMQDYFPLMSEECYFYKNYMKKAKVAENSFYYYVTGSFKNLWNYFMK